MTIRPGVAIYLALAALAAVLFTAAPQLDLSAAALFYRDGFYLAANPILHIPYRLVFYVTDALAILLPLALIVVLLRQRPLFGLDRRAAIFLIVALALGPGLAVNTVLKDHWGRARPSQIVEFGGTKHFTPALQPTDQCDRNCSFPAGHPAIGFYFLTFALLIPAARPRRIMFACAILAGALLGVMRMAQGGHFLSDVIFSGLIVTEVSWVAHALIVRRGGIAALSGWRRMLAIGIVCVLAGAASFAFYDRPVAIWAHGLSPRIHHLFAFITQFGESYGWLILSVVAFFVFYFIVRRRHYAWQVAFVFVNVAASGIVVDIVKVIFARARPTLLFSDGVYGFTWFATRSDHWSFPSGHAATVSSLALSLTTMWPRGWPIWWLAAALILASRIVINAHYPSDLLGGFYVALLVWWTARGVFDRYCLPLRENP
ncbi:MAG TPA: phosphatase PAP2 family protein [Stellaceae bacterium]|nr:phosphatase PAP2 family protein [Stellaceae bacterium]